MVVKRQELDLEAEPPRKKKPSRVPPEFGKDLLSQSTTKINFPLSEPAVIYIMSKTTTGNHLYSKSYHCQ